MRELRDVFGEPAYRIGPKHWQSGFPRPFRDLSRHGVDVVVLASAEVQPDAEARKQIEEECPDLSVILCPLLDIEDRLYLESIKPRLVKVAKLVLQCLSADKRVLVTCSAGRNRSGLISGLVHMLRFGLTGAEAVARIKSARPDALTNDVFRRYLESL